MCQSRHRDREAGDGDESDGRFLSQGERWMAAWASAGGGGTVGRGNDAERWILVMVFRSLHRNVRGADDHLG